MRCTHAMNAGRFKGLVHTCAASESDLSEAVSTQLTYRVCVVED